MALCRDHRQRYWAGRVRHIPKKHAYDRSATTAEPEAIPFVAHTYQHLDALPALPVSLCFGYSMDLGSWPLNARPPTTPGDSSPALTAATQGRTGSHPLERSLAPSVPSDPQHCPSGHPPGSGGGGASGGCLPGGGPGFGAGGGTAPSVVLLGAALASNLHRLSNPEALFSTQVG